MFLRVCTHFSSIGGIACYTAWVYFNVVGVLPQALHNNLHQFWTIAPDRMAVSELGLVGRSDKQIFQQTEIRALLAPLQNINFVVHKQHGY